MPTPQRPRASEQPEAPLRPVTLERRHEAKAASRLPPPPQRCQRHPRPKSPTAVPRRPSHARSPSPAVPVPCPNPSMSPGPPSSPPDYSSQHAPRRPAAPAPPPAGLGRAATSGPAVGRTAAPAAHLGAAGALQHLLGEGDHVGAAARHLLGQQPLHRVPEARLSIRRAPRRHLALPAPRLAPPGAATASAGGQNGREGAGPTEGGGTAAEGPPLPRAGSLGALVPAMVSARTPPTRTSARAWTTRGCPALPSVVRGCPVLTSADQHYPGLTRAAQGFSVLTTACPALTSAVRGCPVPSSADQGCPALPRANDQGCPGLIPVHAQCMPSAAQCPQPCAARPLPGKSRGSHRQTPVPPTSPQLYSEHPKGSAAPTPLGTEPRGWIQPWASPGPQPAGCSSPHGHPVRPWPCCPHPPARCPAAELATGPAPSFPPPRPPDKETSPPPGQGDDPTAGIKAPHTATAPQPAPPCCCWVPCC